MPPKTFAFHVYFYVYFVGSCEKEHVPRHNTPLPLRFIRRAQTHHASKFESMQRAIYCSTTIYHCEITVTLNIFGKFIVYFALVLDSFMWASIVRLVRFRWRCQICKWSTKWNGEVFCGRKTRFLNDYNAKGY